MFPFKICSAGQRCECSCHKQKYMHEKDKNCCNTCEYCKLKIKTEYVAIHKACHKAEKIKK